MQSLPFPYSQFSAARAVLRTRGAFAAAAVMSCGAWGFAQEDSVQPEPPAAPQRMYIREYCVLGARELPRIEVEEAVYPYLGPARTEEDVEHARAALEKAYQAKGYQSASVSVPPQQGRGGVIFLMVTEGRVAQLRVKGARYFLPSDIKAKARALAEGKAVNFNEVARDIVALNQLPDRQVTPSVTAGAEPGTLNVDLNVTDKFPLHASLELNNRRSPDTTPLRLNGSASYNNLWQAGHSIGASFQISPEDPSETKVFSGYYIARFPNVDWLSLKVEGTKQDSNVNTLGAVAVAGKGEVIGARAVFTLPTGVNFYQSAEFGFDYKHFNQAVTLGAASGPGARTETPITYYPVSANYSATWAPKGSVTELNLGLTFGVRGLGTRSRVHRDPDENGKGGEPGRATALEENRFGADSNFIYLRGDLSHTHDLPKGFEAFAKVQGQISDQPLVNSEQFSGGGLGTARGYLEAETLGDNAIFGTVELRSPSILGRMPGKGNDWRFYLFGDAGYLSLRDALPDQKSSFRLASFGIGSRMQLFEHLNGSVDLAIPVISQTHTEAGIPRLTFRVWADF